jgi:2-hydroxy-6-oxonona-2,4-dienedioate hydrolase
MVTIGKTPVENATEKYVEMSHGKTRYFDAGTGYPTILIHGVGYTGGGHGFFLNIGPLSSKLRVLAPDCLGWGEGDVLEQEYSFAYLVDFIREFQDSLGLEKTNIVGHSMGGWLASLFAYESPERVNKLVLVAAGGAMPRQLPSMVEFQPPTRESILKQLTNSVKKEGVDLEALADYNVKMADNPTRLAAYRRILAHMNNMETRSRYNTVRRFPHIKAPTLITWGRNDQTNALELGEMTHAGIPGSKMVVFECGHMIPTEAPDEFNAALLDFLPD